MANERRSHCSPRFSQIHSPKQRTHQDHTIPGSLWRRVAGYLPLLIEFNFSISVANGFVKQFF